MPHRVDRATWLYERICERPGRTIRQIEIDTGAQPGSLYALLGGLDRHGLLVYEDEQGRIYPVLCERGNNRATLC